MNNLCECGCGKEVTNKRNRFIIGHNTTGSKQSIVTISKRKNTMFQRYGVEHSQQSSLIRNKSKNTLLQNFGVEHPIQSNKIKEKIKQSCLIKFGVENPSRNKEIQIKKEHTSLKKYGTKSSNQNNDIKEKKKQTLLKHYGVDHFSKTPEFKKIARETMLHHIQKQYDLNELPTPCIGELERNCLDELQKLINFNILRNKCLFGYYPDGLIEELKLDIEFDESHHKTTKQIKHDKERDEFFIKQNYKIFRISENEWLKNKEPFIHEFRKIINEAALIKSVPH